MKKVSLILAAVAAVAIMGGVALADNLYYPYILCDSGLGMFSSDVYITNLNATDNVVVSLFFYDLDGLDLVTNPATTITIQPAHMAFVTLDDVLTNAGYTYPTGFVKCQFAIQDAGGAAVFNDTNVAFWGGLTVDPAGVSAGYLFFPKWY